MMLFRSWFPSSHDGEMLAFYFHVRTPECGGMGDGPAGSEPLASWQAIALRLGSMLETSGFEFLRGVFCPQCE